MMAHYNTSGFESFIYPTFNRQGYETVVAVIKATFKIGAEGKLIEDDEQEGIAMEDRFRGNPAATSVLYESDLAIYKPGTDVVVNGEAWALGLRPSKRVDVTIEVGPLRKKVRVFGDRVWQRFAGVGPLMKSTPVPFKRMPLIYERVFGGVDSRTAKGLKSKFDGRNPVGQGFQAGIIRKSGVPLPNLENPADLIVSPRQRPAPWGVGFVGRGWEPRRNFAGSCDKVWMKKRMPFLPENFDYRFFQGASTDLVSSTHFRGDEYVHLVNLTPEGVLDFHLPGLCMGLSILWRDRRQRCLAALDTVIIEPTQRRVILVWRRAFVCWRKPTEIFKVVSFAVKRWAAREVLGSDGLVPLGEPCYRSQ
jgi:hypothetical protein